MSADFQSERSNMLANVLGIVEPRTRFELVTLACLREYQGNALGYLHGASTRLSHRGTFWCRDIHQLYSLLVDAIHSAIFLISVQDSTAIAGADPNAKARIDFYSLHSHL